MSNDDRSPLDEILCAALAAGALLVLLVPGARGNAAIGWLPMWLVAMPAVAWWAVKGFPLPRARPVVARRGVSARRLLPQARRSARPARQAAARRVA